MPAIPKKTKTQVARIVALYGENRSITEIAKLERLSRPTIRKWLEDSGIAIRKEKVDTPAQREQKARREKAAAIVTAATALELAPTDSPGMGIVKERLAQMRALLESELADVGAGDVNGSAFSKLAETELKYVSKLDELTRASRPPEKPDPDKDPTTAETVNKLIAKLEALVVHEEKARG